MVEVKRFPLKDFCSLEGEIANPRKIFAKRFKCRRYACRQGKRSSERETWNVILISLEKKSSRSCSQGSRGLSQKLSIRSYQVVSVVMQFVNRGIAEPELFKSFASLRYRVELYRVFSPFRLVGGMDERQCRWRANYTL